MPDLGVEREPDKLVQVDELVGRGKHAFEQAPVCEPDPDPRLRPFRRLGPVAFRLLTLAEF